MAVTGLCLAPYISRMTDPHSPVLCSNFILTALKGIEPVTPSVKLTSRRYRKGLGWIAPEMTSRRHACQRPIYLIVLGSYTTPAEVRSFRPSV